MDTPETQSAEEANRLYWETDLSVNEIAQRLDISRRALYGAIRPVPASGRCESCSGELEFTNRSTRAHGFATCRSCGLQRTADPEPAWTWSPPSPAPAPPTVAAWPRSVWWLGAATLGSALAAAGVTLLLVRGKR